MKQAVYLVVSAASFVAGASVHAVSYFRDIPRAFLSGAWVAAVVLCVPLILLFVRLRKEKSAEPVWPHFWNTVIARCPRWIWGSMSIAWLLAMGAFVLSILGYETSPMVFQSAVVLIPIAAALSYSGTLVRQQRSDRALEA